MKLLKTDQKGFIPLLLTVTAVVVIIIYLVFTRVLDAQGGLHL